MLKRIIIILASFLSLILVIILGYAVYLCSGYYRIEDLKEYHVEAINNKTLVKTNEKYAITTYNIGFGAYTHDFSFFMDSGCMLNGKKVTGKDSKAESKDVVEKNINGSIEAIKNLSPDFMLYQEVDVNATRSFGVNQFALLKEAFSNHNSLYVSNFHSRFLFYPIFKPHGKVEAGLVMQTNKLLEKTVRYKLQIDESFPTKFFDLDRCFTVSYLPIENSDKYLVIVNAHLSAYDKGGIYRSKQWEQLTNFFNQEVSKGNYIVCGGDFNHDITNNQDFKGFETKQYTPDWVYKLTQADLDNKSPFMRFVTNTNAPTCRSTDIPYEKGVNYTTVLDGFIVSNNIEVNLIENIDLDFMYSDHNPVYMEFILK